VTALPGVAAAAVEHLATRLRGGRLTLVDGDRTRRFGDGSGDLDVEVVVHDPRLYRALLVGGSRALGATYSEGWWDADDLPALVRMLICSLDPLDRVRIGAHRVTAPVLDPIRRLRRPDPRRDRHNVQAHYDLSNDFFALFLDATMTYSCAVFERPDMTLEQAQTAKLDRLCRLVGLQAGHDVIEIGTGWGSMALHAASCYGARVTTTTVSAAQRGLAEQRVEARGLAGRVRVLGDDYRDLTGSYDRLLSVEMIEAVDWRDHGAFFSACGRLLRPDGCMAMQAIVIADRRYDRARVTSDFIKERIFPGGCLPSVGSVVRASARHSDLQVVSIDDITPHYVTTRARGRATLAERADRLPALGLDERFRRLWEFYLAYCEAGFAERHVSAVQMLLAKPRWR
jgi:cyclopropane-fatty-acyl-phospholipid synthase